MLIVNLQDRTSWKEYARARALESLQINAEFSHQLFVLTLPKDTAFYYQTNEYINLNKAEDFIESFRAQLSMPEENGFLFPPQVKKEKLNQFIEAVLPAIHKWFFGEKNSLTRRNRENFIEIFYQFLILKCIDELNLNVLGFVCKDGIDTSSAQQGIFYGFLKIYNQQFNAKEEQDSLRSLFYMPALFTRERAIDQERFIRAISVLELLDGEMSQKGKKISSVFNKL